MTTKSAKKSIGRFWKIVITLFCIAVIILAIPIFENKLRSPSEKYESVEEEYIAAIKTFIETKEVIVPEGAYFYFDNETIRIVDIKTGAKVTCDFVLDGTVPVYKWEYDSYQFKLFLGFAFLVVVASSLFLYSILYNITMAIYLRFKKSSDKRKQKNLNKNKASAMYGDERIPTSRSTLPTCIGCERFENCKCLNCIYVEKCGRCPSPDCEYAFEDFLSDKINEEQEMSEVFETNEDVFDECSEENSVQNTEIAGDSEIADESNKTTDSEAPPISEEQISIE